jgi:bifunctional DNA-binding transcriptional regulator/antitoxin component of YhaV-PrlF toxin-antitoxin module
MHAKLNHKGQITVPQQIRDALNLQPSCRVHFDLSATGKVTLRKVQAESFIGYGSKSNLWEYENRFENVRGRADIAWRTDDLTKLLRE